MTSRCSVCGVTAEEMKPWGALVIHTQRIGRRLVEWAECLKCCLEEMRAK